MGQTVFHDLYALSKRISIYLPLSGGLPLDEEVSDFVSPQAIPSQIPEGRHWAVVSQTGNGKTTFDKALIRAHLRKQPYLNVYILDSKKQGDFDSRDGKVYLSYEPPPVLTGIGQRQVWQPMVDDLDMYDQYFRNILEHGRPCIVLVDESKNLKQGMHAPKGYELILAQGRLPGIHVITNYQEVANGLRQGLSQATHVVGFSVSNPYDENALKRYLQLPTKEPMQFKGPYSFYYINKKKQSRPVLYTRYQQFIPQFMTWPVAS